LEARFMGRIVRCYGMGKIVGAAADFDSIFKQHMDSVRAMKFHGTTDREDIGSAGHEDPEGGPRSGWAVSIAGSVSGPVYLPDEILFDRNQHKGSPGAASFVKRTLSEDCLPDEVDTMWRGVSMVTSNDVSIKSIRRIKPDFYEVEAEIRLDGIE
jgi:hypothetical protein